MFIQKRKREKTHEMYEIIWIFKAHRRFVLQENGIFMLFCVAFTISKKIAHHFIEKQLIWRHRNSIKTILFLCYQVQNTLLDKLIVSFFLLLSFFLLILISTSFSNFYINTIKPLNLFVNHFTILSHEEIKEHFNDQIWIR